ncbi:MAG: hypothetical protein RLZZ584_3959 [Pseudomonadota bacterium]
MTAPQIAHAKLIPMNGEQVETDTAQHITVQFNPATLRLNLSNTLRAETGGGRSRAAAQFVDKSESTLAVELVFDATIAQPGAEAGSDVRQLTRRIADTYMKPVDADSAQPRAPRRCRFQWGRFQFTGMLSAYGETLDFFAPEGIPLRATLALTFKEDRYQFEAGDESVQAAARQQPRFAPGGDGLSADRAAQAAGGRPQDWRLVADLNLLENPRFTPDAGVLVPRGPAGIGISGGGVSISASGPTLAIGLAAPSVSVRTRP